eukprot:Phypoly_transcript_15850.p1 GENE.Phypoly_transcript_15850~~Phypoly_transcript_15850.p1  ORF type:complete len:270 (+),score=45.88 Phypoly_transcript_15850:78-887(+)
MAAIAFVKGNETDKLKQLKKEDADVTDEDGLTPLHWAARNGSLSIVTLLVGLGVDINKQAHSGFTPTQEAAKQKHYEVITYLLDAGADVNLQDAHGRTVLHASCEAGDLKCAQLCVRHAKKISINLKDMFDRTALHWACRQGFVQLVEDFISNGADVNAKTQTGDTPLHWASLNGQIEICKILVSKGADATSTNTKGETTSQVATTPQLRDFLEDIITQQVIEKTKVAETEEQQRLSQQQNSNDSNAPTTAIRMTAKPAAKKLKITLKK